MRLLCLLLAVGAAPAAAGPPPQPPPGEAVSVMQPGPDGRMYQLEVAGDSALVRDLGPFGGPIRPGIPVAVPTVAVDSVGIPFRTLEVLVGNLSNYEPPSDRVGVGIEGTRVWVEFARGVELWRAIAAGLALLLAGGLATAAVFVRRERRRRRAEAAARQRALHAREAERTRIARDLHDGPLQDVHALRLLGTAGDAVGVGEEAGRIARELRAIAEGLRPPALGRFGLAAALSAHANRVKDRHPTVAIALDLDEDGTGDRALPDVVRAALFRIAQEAITNAIEHGGATRLRVALSLPAPDAPAAAPIALEVADDGSGLGGAVPDLEALADAGHFGLVGMHERAEAVGGRLTLSAGGIGGRGTRVRAELPDVRRPAAARRARFQRPLLSSA